MHHLILFIRLAAELPAAATAGISGVVPLSL